MGRRKFRLWKRKNAERKSIPEPTPSIRLLIKNINRMTKDLPRGWVVVDTGLDSTIVLSKPIFALGSTQQTVTLSVVIDTDCKWSVRFPHLERQDCLSSVLTNFPAIFCSVESIVSLLTAINLADRCTGNADEKFHALREYKKMKFMNTRRE